MLLHTELNDQVSKLMRRVAVSAVVCCLLFAVAARYSDNFVPMASAVGEERSLSFYNIHTEETISVTFKSYGRYIPSAMVELNWIMRDWRLDEETQMDPEVFDLIWSLSVELGVSEPIHVISGFRSQATNDALRQAGRRVARRSMHIQGQAIDLYFPGVPVEDLRNSALVREVGGVGYYPRSGQNGFVHVDTGNVRHWPRIGEQQLARIFSEHRERRDNATETQSGPIQLAGNTASAPSPETQTFPLPADKPVLMASADTTPETAPAIAEPIVIAGNQSETVNDADQPGTQQLPAPVQASAASFDVASLSPDEPDATQDNGQRNLMFFPLAILRPDEQATSGMVRMASYQPGADGTFQEVVIMRGSVDDLTEEEQAVLASFEASAREEREFTSNDIQRLASQIVVQSSKGSLQMSEHGQGPAIANGRGGRLDAPETIIDLIRGTEELVVPAIEAEEPPATLRLGLEDTVGAPGDVDGEQPISVLAGTLQ